MQISNSLIMIFLKSLKQENIEIVSESETIQNRENDDLNGDLFPIQRLDSIDRIDSEDFENCWRRINPSYSKTKISPIRKKIKLFDRKSSFSKGLLVNQRLRFPRLKVSSKENIPSFRFTFWCQKNSFYKSNVNVTIHSKVILEKKVHTT